VKPNKYLGEDSHNNKNKNEKQRVKKEYVRRLRLILNTELSTKNEGSRGEVPGERKPVIKRW